MPSLKEFVAALQAGWFPALVALIRSGLVIGGDAFKIPYLDSTPRFIITALVIVAVFSFSILVANVVYAPVFLWKKWQKRKLKAKFRDLITSRINGLPDQELAILAYLVSSGRRAFSADLNDRRLVPLVALGMIQRQGGVHDMLNWPHVVQTDVWDHLVAHRSEYMIENVDQLPDPFSRSW